MEDEIIYKPKELYDKMLKSQFHEEAENFYRELAEQTHTDIEANKDHVRLYDGENAKLQSKKGDRSKEQSKKGWLIFLAVVCFIAAVVCIVVGIMLIKKPGMFALIIGGAVLIAGGILILALPVRKFSAKIKSLSEEISNQEAKVKKLYAQCCEDMAALNSALDWNMPAQIMQRKAPILQIDKRFTNERYQMLREHYGLWEDKTPNSSTVGILSGEIKGNPFFLQRCFEMNMGTKTYTGTLVIHWTTTYKGSDGKLHTQHHTQTLVAHHTAPCPYYSTVTTLVYGNEAAPRLSFSRKPSNAHTLNEKQKRKEIEKGSKELKKLAETQLKKGNSHVFNPIGNDEFDVFYGASDRDNEVEFRLLFTPLAQRNMLDLIEDPQPYGDDFYMAKKKMINLVQSAHSQVFDYYADPSYFASHSFELGLNKFVSYCDDFIKHLYFDLAPLMSIPLYQMHKSHEYIYRDDNERNYPVFEQEVMANSLGYDEFRPKNAASDMPVIIKAIKTKKDEETDIVTINGASFRKENRMTLVPTMGGDGKLHPVPVHWIEYFDEDEDFTYRLMNVEAKRSAYLSNRNKLENTTYQRGYIAYGPRSGKNITKDFIRTIFNKNKE